MGRLSRRGPDSRRRVLLAALIATATLVVYAPAPLGHEFTNYDDDQYVTHNPRVLDGLTLESLRWAMTATRAANWHPLTWLSHMIDVELFGLDPRGHHLTSVLLHVANALLLFLALDRMTGAAMRSGFVAAAFALHPLHVESVAWIAERKDVLSTLFGLLALLAWARYAEQPRPRRMVAVAVALALGLLAKPMLVTLPFLLLLLDRWPLGRWTGAARDLPALLREKLPLFALAAASCVVTFLVQRGGRTVGTMEQFPLAARLSNAAVAYAGYVRKMLWPSDLAVFYPHPLGTHPPWQVAGAALLLAGVSALALLAWRRRPHWTVGWLWYVGSLVPVIGLVQVGEQSMADRYTYLPLVGLFLAIAWGVPEMLGGPLRQPRIDLSGRVRVAAGLAALVAMSVATAAQVGRWRDTETLFRHALAVTRDNYVAYLNLGIVVEARGDLDGAMRHYGEALRINPRSHLAHNNLGLAFAKRGRWREAESHYRAALEIDPAFAPAHNNLGIALASAKRLEEAVASFRESARLEPADASTRFNFGTALANLGRWDEAIEQFRAAIGIRPGYGDAHFNLAMALHFKGEPAEAWRQLRLAERNGFAPPPEALDMLRSRMPDP